MTNNKLYIFFGIFITLFFLALAGFSGGDIGAGRLRIGTAYINDSTSGILTINKGLRINGDFTTKSGDGIYANGDIFMTNGIYRFGDVTAEYGQTGISGSNTNGEILYTGNQHNFWNNSAAMFSIDSATATNTNTNFTKLGSDAPAIKQKLITGVVPAVSGTLSTAHGITNYRRIIQATFLIRDDSLDRVVFPGYDIGVGLRPGYSFYVNGANMVYITPATSVNLPGDTIKMLITYLQ